MRRGPTSTFSLQKHNCERTHGPFFLRGQCVRFVFSGRMSVTRGLLLSKYQVFRKLQDGVIEVKENPVGVGFMPTL